MAPIRACFFTTAGIIFRPRPPLDVKLRRARRLSEMSSAQDVQVWKDDTPTRFRDMWAAEFHLLDSGNGPRWYLYYTAG